MFSNSVAGADASVVIYILMLICRACDVEPYSYTTFEVRVKFPLTEEIIEELLAATSRVITEVSKLLPKDFPSDVAKRIFQELEDPAQAMKKQRE